jgi:hypothetical protein
MISASGTQSLRGSILSCKNPAVSSVAVLSSNLGLLLCTQVKSQMGGNQNSVDSSLSLPDRGNRHRPEPDATQSLCGSILLSNLTLLLAFLGFFDRGGPDEDLKFAHKLGHIGELEVYGGKADVCDLIQGF